MSTVESPVVSPPHPAVVSGGRLPYFVAALSTLYAVLGACWVFEVGTYPFGAVPPDGDRLSLLSQVPDGFGAGLVAVLGALGVPAALATVRPGWSASAYRPLLFTAAVQAVVFGLLCTDISVVIVVGYTLVLAGVPAFLLMLVAGAWRTPGTRVLLAVVAVGLTALILVTGVVNRRAFRELGEGLAGVPGKLGYRPLLVLGAFALGAGWAVLGIRSARLVRARCVRCGRPGASWTSPASAARWGRWVTIVAALCPMPYAVLRFSWLLPNPIGFSAQELDAEPGIKMFGLGLGTIAFCAGLVTLGLIRPWGEVWPRWVPVLAGRPVPLNAAVIPGTTAALLLIVGSPSLIGMSADDWWLMLLLPFPLWGATVGLATAAYYYRRRTRCTTCGLA